MRRGEVFVSVKHSDRKVDPVVLAVIFGIGGIIFFVLAIVVPVVMTASSLDDLCGPAEALHRGEQQVCSVSVAHDYIAKADKNGAAYVKNYRVPKTDLRNTTHRIRQWEGQANLADGKLAFPLTASKSLRFTLNASCTGSSCDTVKMYYLATYQYRKATADSDFDEGMYNFKLQGLTGNITSYTNLIETSETNFIVFSNKKKDATVSYSITVDYVVYDLGSAKVVSLDDDNEYVFDDCDSSEAIVMEYMDDENKGPDMVDATISQYTSRVAGAVLLGILFGLLAVACFGVTVICILFLLGKLGKFGEKVGKKLKAKTSSSYAAPEMAAEEALKVSVIDEQM